MRIRLAVGRVIVYKSRWVDKTGGPFFKNTSLEPALRNRPTEKTGLYISTFREH
jgi:hypothetical protein